MVTSLTDRIVVVTGGSEGIGRAVALECARQGATVVVAARTQCTLDETLLLLTGISSAGHRAFALDISDLDAVAKFASWCRQEFGNVHGLVQCAAVMGPIGPTLQVDLGAFNAAWKVNFLGTLALIQSFANLFSKGQRRKIVLFGGGGAGSSFPHYSAYACSKVALVRMVENIANEPSCADLDINIIAPGFVATRLHQATIEAGRDAVGEQYFDRTVREISTGGVPSEKAAGLVAFLLSSSSDGITGKFIAAPWDPWASPEFQSKLRKISDFAALRRVDDTVVFRSSGT